MPKVTKTLHGDVDLIARKLKVGIASFGNLTSLRDQMETECDGRKYGVDTHAIFFTRGIFQPLMETYANATVTLAVNRETGMVVVIE